MYIFCHIYFEKTSLRRDSNSERHNDNIEISTTKILKDKDSTRLWQKNIPAVAGVKCSDRQSNCDRKVKTQQ